jgi:hypothetical protein
MRNTDRYGSRYWCCKVTADVSLTQEIYVTADYPHINLDGSISFLRTGDDGTILPNLIIPAGKWWAVYGASYLDGSAVAVDHWIGEVVNDEHDMELEAKLRQERKQPKLKTPRNGGDGTSKRQEMVKKIAERDGWACAICCEVILENEPYHLDHITPRSKGGKDTLDNLQLTHMRCNIQKGNRTRDEDDPITFKISTLQDLANMTDEDDDSDPLGDEE